MTTPVAKLHPSITAQFANAEIRAVQVEAVANHLASLMKEIHGGNWRVQIDHEVGLVMVVVKL